MTAYIVYNQGMISRRLGETALCKSGQYFVKVPCSTLDVFSDTGSFSCYWPGFNPAHPDVTPCGDDYLKVLLLEG